MDSVILELTHHTDPLSSLFFHCAVLKPAISKHTDDLLGGTNYTFR